MLFLKKAGKTNYPLFILNILLTFSTKDLAINPHYLYALYIQVSLSEKARIVGSFMKKIHRGEKGVCLASMKPASAEVKSLPARKLKTRHCGS